jgi:hypothetical protein
MTQQQMDVAKFLLSNAVSKEGERIPSDKTVKDISAVSFYYMLDKNAWQLKVWTYPTNRSKTFNLPIKESDFMNWVDMFKTINNIEFNKEVSPWD